jgi:two-component system response regulator HydG
MSQSSQTSSPRSSRGNILVVDDEAVITDSLAHWLTEDGYVVGTAGSAAEALRRLQERSWDLAILDIKMPGMDGLELQHRLHEIDPLLQVIVMTGYASVDGAVLAMKQGAYDYLPKPFCNTPWSAAGCSPTMPDCVSNWRRHGRPRR